MKEAIRHTLEIFALTSGQIRPGATEAGIASFVQAEVERRGLGYAWDRGTCPSVFTGPDTAGAHYGPTGRHVRTRACGEYGFRRSRRWLRLGHSAVMVCSA